MRFGKYVLMAMVAVSMTGSSVAAQAAGASQGVIARTGAGMKGADDLGGRIFSGGAFVIPALVLIAALLAVLVSADSGEAPVSP